MQGTKILLWAVIHSQRMQTLTTCRYAHSAASTIPWINSRAHPPNAVEQSTLLPCLKSGERSDLHARKRRRYSEDQDRPVPPPPSKGKFKTRKGKDRWEAVENSSLLVRPRKAVIGKKPESIAVRTRQDEDSVPFENGNRRVPKGRTPPSTSEAEDGDKGRLVSKGNRALFLPHNPKEWQVQKKALLQKFKDEGWKPRKRLSPDTLDGIRALHEQDPERYSTPALSEHFKISPEAIRRILKSKFRPSEAQLQDRRERWARRHDRIWDQKTELGLRPKRTGERRLEEPEEFEENLKAKELLDAARSS
ncbi:uncharacterized protein A1O9_06296 [Exophiala aquamarina CBS 119918]|uniref:Required for respiratory growth protein 9, mitochondrial n=1 Tax=Exophiala aquamarina CBS 119918 TaxID=1182545 RepID=A0A072PS90_9EURO|nr:uncharacterized protein A1O9_06296 [Exophiala aquamarina CBS 119918]KEF58370.1 hypothetical protein A1O9_06296 [Exophiala aquamarina CBS 119918]